MSSNKITLIFIFLLAFIQPAIGADSTSPDSYGAQMIEAGMKMFANSLGDSMISLGTGNSTVDRAEIPSLIFKMITYTVDPLYISLG